MGTGVIVGTDGLPVLLKGIIWSGFQNGTMLAGFQVTLVVMLILGR